MALFKVSIKQSGQYNGCKVEKGMEVEVPYNDKILLLQLFNASMD